MALWPFEGGDLPLPLDDAFDDIPLGESSCRFVDEVLSGFFSMFLFFGVHDGEELFGLLSLSRWLALRPL